MSSSGYVRIRLATEPYQISSTLALLIFNLDKSSSDTLVFLDFMCSLHEFFLVKWNLRINLLIKPDLYFVSPVVPSVKLSLLLTLLF